MLSSLCCNKTPHIMKTLSRSFAQIFQRSNQSATKILLLGAGLAMGLVLIAKIYFEQTYENFVPDLDRIYKVSPIYETNEGTEKDYYRTPGAIAPAVMRYSPAVEAATRWTFLAEEATIAKVDNSGNNSTQKYHSRYMILADSCFFDIFDQKRIIAGNSKQILGRPNYVLVSQSLAEKIGGANFNSNDVVGMNFASEFNSSVVLTIDGIYKDFPKNSEFRDVDIIVSLPTIGWFMYDGTENWLGNDRYYSYIKIKKGSSATDVDAGIDMMCKLHINSEELVKAGIKISYRLLPLGTFHAKNVEVRKMCNILLILSLAVLITSVLNYVLITISALVHKAKAIAVHKCYGAARSNIFAMIFSEAFANLLLSIVIAALLVIVFQNITRDLVGTSLVSLFSGNSSIILLIVCLAIFLICGFLPGMVYSKIPVATAFRRYKESNRRWKHALLFVQFIASTFFISLLLVVVMQYRFMLNSDPGYAYKNMVYLTEKGMTMEQKQLIKQELSNFSFIEAQTFASDLPMEGASGNNIYLPGDETEYFNIADMYCVDDGFFKLMEIPIIDGSNFNEENPIANQVMVSRKFVEKMSGMTDWSEGAIGKQIIITQHSHGKGDAYTICGVYDDYLIGYIGNEDIRPSVQFYSKSDKENFKNYMNFQLIKLREVTPENMNAINNKVAELFPNRDIPLKSYSVEMDSLYVDSRHFRDSVLIAGLVVLIITIIGLIGYSHDEINRRRSEIAVRKINGATVSELLKLFMNNIVKLASVAVVAGGVIAYFVSDKWLEQFSQKIHLDWWLFVLCAALTIVIVSVVVALTTYKAANANPVENLKNE